MDTLTLARCFCEMSLVEMELVTERGSLLASACLLMALVTKDLGGWVGLPNLLLSPLLFSTLLYSIVPFFFLMLGLLLYHKFRSRVF